MGGNILRRKILNSKIQVLLFFLIFYSFISANRNFAAEEAAPAPESSRPLRSGRAQLNADHPKSRGTLPPSYRSGKEAKPGSLLLNRSYMEHPLTRQYIRQYTTSGGLSWLFAVMERADPYLAFIRKEIARMNLPEELIYLPVIESGYLPTALSRSGAAGLWQFMKNSIAPFDMKVNDWVDERRDFWKSTQGALRKLDENYRYFGDWPLALAAYNAGLGAVNQAIQRGGARDYWILSQKNLLKTETVHYLPKLLAAAYVLSDPRRYGKDPRWPDDPRWKRVLVDRSADLGILAAEAGIDRGELVRANRELLHSITPPGQNYYLKVSGKDAEKVEAVLARKDLPLIHYYFHTVRSGDTLLALALHYGVTVEQIVQSNPGIQARFLRIGSRLLVPALKETGPYVQPQAPGGNLEFNGTHLVKRGETLWSIALAYEVNPEVLAEVNGMELTDILREGRTLKTPIK